MTSALGDDDDAQPLTKKARRQLRKIDAQDKMPLPSVIHPSTKWKTIMIPSNLWPAVKDEHRKFVLDYNIAARASEPLPSPPDGVTVGAAKEEGNKGMTKLGGGSSTVRRQRKVVTTKEKEEPPKKE